MLTRVTWSRVAALSCDAGLTIAKIERLERGVLHISGVDLVDGTPVLDIKPYLPRYDSLPDATGEQQSPLLSLSHAPW
jgi:tRNA (Thr-GGU) A37 N-methylase